MDKRKVNVEKRVIKVVSDRLGIDESDITTASNFANDLGADSLDIVEVIMHLESEFSIAIPDEVSENMETVQDAINFIEDKVNH